MVYHTVPSLADDDLDDHSTAYVPKTQSRVENVSDTTHDCPVTRSWVGTALMQGFAVAWLIPIAVLLWLNFSNHVIGQSAWCPRNNCDNGTFDANSIIAAANMGQYTKQDHNLLGFLQLVAKALEMWFALVGIWLAYLLMIRMASSKQGLPLEYLSRPSRMGQTWANFSPQAWAPLLSRGSPGRRRLWVFFLVTLVVSILSALMGPATAVLVLPTQLWAETVPFYPSRFQDWNANSPPSLDFLASQNTLCSAQDVNNRAWSCAYTGYGRFFDYWALYTFSNGSWGYQTPGYQNPYYWFQENGMSFVSNATSANLENTAQIPSWVPSRQVIDWLGNDANYYSAIQYEPPIWNGNNMQDTFPPGEFAQYSARRKALRLEARRGGPILGYVSNVWPAVSGFGAQENIPDTASCWTVDIGGGRGIRCYPFWAYQSQAELMNPTPGNNYTCCIQTGD